MRHIFNIKIHIIAAVLCGVLLTGGIKAQAPAAEFRDINSATWLNTYGNIRLSNNLFWDLQTHFRFQEKDNVPFMGQWAQVYNRHGLGYIFSNNFNTTVGFVHRYNNNLDGVAFDESKTNSEWRIWHQYKFAMPFPRLVVYHRLRLEHRWAKGFENDSKYFFRNRYRYMFKLKIPLNKKRLEEKAFYLSPEAELIMQSGSRVVNSPMEDLRLHLSAGYIVNYKLFFAAGLMYAAGQQLNDGTVYKQRIVFRAHLYYTLSLPKWKKQNLPFNLLN